MEPGCEFCWGVRVNAVRSTKGDRPARRALAGLARPAVAARPRAYPSQDRHNPTGRMSPPWLLARHHPLGPFPRKPSAVDWRANLAYSGRALALGRRSSPADVATPYSPVCLRPESPFQLHQRPDLGAVDSDVGLHMCRYPRNCGQIHAEQLGALLQWRGDRPGVGRVVRFQVPTLIG
jgi:hypothetical protein